ncbi:MAG TPA: cysteine rich repeat-containing protein [Anaeromyxobacteraceae bacterium]|nr:cysteine rich repeat-containing protein [Anaeromyxobacteraceae bacterium]
MRTMARVVLFALVSLGIARADDACKADVEKLCAGIPAGGGRILSCLKANQTKVSPGCKQQLAALAKKVKEIGAACEADVDQFCPTVTPGHGAVLKCLSSNSASLQPACQQIVQKATEKLAEFKKACGADAKKFCQGIPAGQGRILSCLKSRQADLTPACQAMMQ